MLAGVVRDDRRDILLRGAMHEGARPGLVWAWSEVRYNDPEERREVVGRIGIARGGQVQALLTFDFWPEDLGQHTLEWEVILATLDLGKTIHDPAAGGVVS